MIPALLRHPIAFVHQRFHRWLEVRLTPRDSYTLTQHNVYILPTRPGFMLALTLLVLLVAAINYQLNLGYLLTFLLAGSAVVGMHVCHSNLRGLTLHLIAPSASYAGDNVVFDVIISSQRRTVRHGIALSVLGSQAWAWADVPAQGSASLQVAWRVAQRGWVHLPMLTAETRFPMGTFRVWTVWRPAAKVLVYPAPETHAPPLPPGEPCASGMAAQHSTHSGEFDGVRPYRRGDPLKTVVWKKAAKALAAGSDELVSRDTQQRQHVELWLDIALTGLPNNPSATPTEARLSRLCAWVLRAEQQGLHYGLRLPQHVIAPSSGEAHKRQCLEALALC